MSKKVITRLPPSPTGKLHMGNARSLLFSFLYARHEDGKVIFRSEDTDRERSRSEFEKDILDSLEWLGITFDEFYRQSERGEIYQKHLENLIRTNKAYISKEKITEENKLPEVIRLRNPNRSIVFTDTVRGEITFDTTELSDIVIAKNLKSPLYHFAVVVDDFEMGVTNIIRGEDHISNTPRQILIQEAIGAPRPIYTHLPLVLAPDRSKLSKRHGATAVSDYRTVGYLSGAIVNFLTFLGWSPSGGQEIFSLEELIKIFDLEKIQKSGGVFNLEKLNWFNKEHLKRLSKNERLLKTKDFIPERIKDLPQFNEERLEKSLDTLLERVNNFGEMKKVLEEGEFDYLFAPPKLSEEILISKSTATKEEVKTHLGKLVNILERMTQFNKENIKEGAWPYAEERGRAKVLWPMRVALTGREKSPDPFTVAEIIGKTETISRLQNAAS